MILWKQWQFTIRKNVNNVVCLFWWIRNVISYWLIFPSAPHPLCCSLWYGSLLMSNGPTILMMSPEDCNITRTRLNTCSSNYLHVINIKNKFFIFCFIMMDGPLLTQTDDWWHGQRLGSNTMIITLFFNKLFHVAWTDQSRQF